ncbi:MAG: ABC-F family ATP-binding cassette domain-containing protein [Pseudomonadota bacterium]
MIAIRSITFAMAGRPLFEGASAVIQPGKTVGIVGRNGTGKSTLFRLIRGELPLEGGEIEVPRTARLGGVAQEAPGTQASLLDTVLEADEERAALLADDSDDPARIAWREERLTAIEAHSAEARASNILRGLGFDAAAQARACAEFSGGWRMRVALAATLFSRPDILLLDEPTNYLDLEGTVWLEMFLAETPSTALVISHDRGLLNRSVDQILHLDHRKLTLYGGAYDQFEAERRQRAAHLAAQAEKQAKARAHMQSFVDRFRYKASKAKQAQSRLKMLEKMDPIEVSRDGAVSGFAFPSPAELPPPLMQAEGVTLGYDGEAVLRGVTFRMDQDDRIALLGANGQGKSTLAKLISGRLKPMQGGWNVSRGLKVGYFAQHQLDELVEGETPLEHLSRHRPDAPPKLLRSELARAGIGPEIAGNPVDRLSGGQKARLLMMLAAREAPHVMVLDEPTNHLDVQSRDALAQALAAYEGAVVLVSHDPHLVEAVADRLWLVKDGGVAPFEGDMEDYRRLLLSERGAGGRAASTRTEARAKGPKRSKRDASAHRRVLAGLRGEVGKCEERVGKLEAMREQIDAKLMDPDFYQTAEPGRHEALQKKRAEVEEALEKAEALWMEAQARLDAEEAAA